MREESGRDPEGAITRHYLDVNVAFYLTAAVAILFLHNWFSRCWPSAMRAWTATIGLGHMGIRRRGTAAHSRRHRRPPLAREVPGLTCLPWTASASWTSRPRQARTARSCSRTSAAHVVKVEPSGGSPERSAGLSFLHFHRGKRSVSLAPDSDQGGAPTSNGWLSGRTCSSRTVRKRSPSTPQRSARSIPLSSKRRFQASGARARGQAGSPRTWWRKPRAG